MFDLLKLSHEYDQIYFLIIISLWVFGLEYSNQIDVLFIYIYRLCLCDTDLYVHGGFYIVIVLCALNC
jgi:hypothetical protein